ncbi:hypothetical protein COCVIDRAFT_106074, partial [Bipolaris victoriae FI3]
IPADGSSIASHVGSVSDLLSTFMTALLGRISDLLGLSEEVRREIWQKGGNRRDDWLYFYERRGILLCLSCEWYQFDSILVLISQARSQTLVTCIYRY